ncbi:MAG: adenylate kinase [Candidatus Marinimicrobia bacterium]|jgi:adenylate kinase|nr:adenylate kinase [Candidatus Neomarinimicrobiota bacterium]MBT3496378.1 adenylate kinase [Candidatus Neomarinimicrobiota bacterium]MBT3692621.1 adenylate kinase [Candidatus Neomarinimicrobiota bacterium]MBT3732263.1 adenylate kinase [Candidatus Neomarinimicrobiota bacterium]MBT4143701.1 adenylate kinase [Candidatus Neomarinimicrobiota bacterium]
MRLLFMGPPGVGKGTQAKRIEKHYDIVHLSTGDILRSEMKSKSLVGKQAREYIESGHLVPDSVLLKMMAHRLEQEDCGNGFLLDGFPRTLAQANGLDKILLDLKQTLDFAISLTANEDELVNRLVKRGQDSGRSDDTKEIIQHRQKIYWEQTAPLIDFYKNKNLLKEVDGIGEISEITNRILGVLR